MANGNTASMNMSSAELASLYEDLQGLLSREGGSATSSTKLHATCEKVLRLDPMNDYAIKVKMIAFMKAAKFSEALQFMSSTVQQPSMRAGLAFETAYCQYRLHLLTEASKTIEAIPLEKQSRRLKKLSAQVYYRLEKFDASAQLYDALYHDETHHMDDVEKSELWTNFMAARASASLFSNLTNDSNGYRDDALNLKDAPDEETFELLYNMGCCYIGQGKMLEAQRYLNRAQELCRQTLLGEGFSQAEVDEEMAILRVQLAYVQQTMDSQAEEAMKIYQDLLASKTATKAILMVATNNLVAMKRDKDLFVSQRRLKSFIGPATQPITSFAPAGDRRGADPIGLKLNSPQRQALHFNYTLLHLFMGKYNMFKDLLEAYRDAYPKDAMSSVAPFLLAAIPYRQKKLSLCEQELANTKEKSFLARIATMQLMIERHAFDEAFELLLATPIKANPMVTTHACSYFPHVALCDAKASFQGLADHGHLPPPWRYSASFMALVLVVMQGKVAYAAAAAAASDGNQAAMTSVDKTKANPKPAVVKPATPQELAKNHETIRGLFDSAIAYHKDHVDEVRASDTAALLLLSAEFTLAKLPHQPRKAASDYETLVSLCDKTSTSSLSPDASFKDHVKLWRQRAMAGLIIAYSAYDPTLAAKYESELPAGDLDGSGPIDGDGLDALNIEEAMIKDIQGRQYRKNYQATAGTDDKKAPRRRKRKRQNPKPANFDPNKTPDPYRWLPMRDRPKTGGKASGGVSSRQRGGHQGASTAPVPAPVATTGATEGTATAPKTNPSANKKKKKKGKGKW